MKVATFNINNINRRLPNLLRWLKAAKPDAVALQELKASDAEFPHHGVQCGPVQSEAGGRGADHSAALPKHAENMLALYLFERVGCGRPGRVLFYLVDRSA